MRADRQINKGGANAASVGRKLLTFVLLSAIFVAIGAYPPLRAHLKPDALDRTIEGLGWLGPICILLLGAFSPLLMAPRWPLAVVCGMAYGVVCGTLLASAASLVGAGLQYGLARTSLRPAAQGWLSGGRWERLLERQRDVFLVLFLIRAFPLSNFVATNLLCGTLRIPARTYLVASALGMIPSTVLYASWGKLTVKPSGEFMFVLFGALAFIALGAVWAMRFMNRAAMPTGREPGL